MSQPANASQTLGALMFRVAMRDQAAFKQLYDDTSHCLFGIVLRMLRDRSWAEEVLQEAYVSIWNTAPSYSTIKSQPMTWLMTIARYKALDALRSSSSERRHVLRPQATAEDDDSGLADIAADERDGPLDRLAQAAESERLRHCLQALEAPQRQAIALAFYDGLTHVELAAHMSQPLGTVKAWVRRGLEKLKPCLQRRAVETGNTR
ncbi:MAG: sigma-70 family RNA polymerase sigma factor [Burkholderiales bacterium]